ncbi:MAG: radical SAM protein [Myxococcus sp.]|nr:radical SAM protein [Myxococcus sp.]
MSELHRERFRGFLEQKVRAGPETVHVDVTNVCNLDCVTCWNYGGSLDAPKTIAWKRQRIDPVVFHRVLAEVAEAGAERIVLSGGGEPFTHPDIEGFIGAVKQKGLRLTVITNGTLCDFARLKALGVDQLLLNVASASPETYVAYHPNQPKETFHRLVEGCRTLRGRTAVNMVQVINGLTAHEVVAMVELAAEVGARVSFKVGDLPQGTAHFALTAAQREALLAEGLPAARKTAKHLGVRHNLDAFERQLRGVKEQQPPCFAGYLYSRISVDGRVFFCCAHIDAGHLNEGPFAQVWRSPRYDAVRQTLHRGGSFAACQRCGKHDMNVAAQRELDVLLSEGALP